MTRAAVIGIAAWLVWVAPVLAQNPPPSPPATTPTAACDQCRALQQGLEALEKALRASEERLKNLDGESVKTYDEMQGAAQEHRQLSAKAAEAGDFVSAETKSRLSQLEATIDNAVMNQWLRSEQSHAEWRAANKLRDQIAALRDTLAKCSQACTTPSSGAAVTTGGAGTTTTGSGSSTTVGPSNACEDCDALKARIDRLQGDLSDIRERLDGIERVQRDVEGLKARAKSDQIQGLDDQLNLLKARRQQATQEQAEKWKEVRELNEKLKDCSKACKPKQTSQLFRGPLPYAAGGGVALAALLVGGGDSPTTIASAPVTPQLPTTTTNPAPQPAPDAIDVLMGVYLVQSCVCELDQGGNDAFLRLCQSARQLRLTRTGTNTGRIDGDPPLITSDFILDANAQTIDGSAIGMAGSLTAALRYSGTFAPAPPRSLTLSLSYAVTNSTTRYRVTAVKQ